MDRNSRPPSSQDSLEDALVSYGGACTNLLHEVVTFPSSVDFCEDAVRVDASVDGAELDDVRVLLDERDVSMAERLDGTLVRWPEGMDGCVRHSEDVVVVAGCAREFERFTAAVQERGGFFLALQLPAVRLCWGLVSGVIVVRPREELVAVDG